MLRHKMKNITESIQIIREKTSSYKLFFSNAIQNVIKLCMAFCKRFYWSEELGILPI